MFDFSNVLSITSKDNPVIKFAISLKDNHLSKKSDFILLEGRRLCEDALLSGVVPDRIIFTSKNQALAIQWCERFAIPSSVSFIAIPDFLFQKIASTQTSQEIALITSKPKIFHSLEDLAAIKNKTKPTLRFVVCEALSDPGNLGTIIRLADGLGFDGVTLVGNSVDPFNNKVIRSAMGSCFHLPFIAFENILDCSLDFKKFDVQLVISDLNGKNIVETHFNDKVAICIGNEAHGLSDMAKNVADFSVTIPLLGQAESYNAATAAAIVAYEVMKQQENYRR